MNFPDKQRIGVVAEVDVERLFLSWGWNVGHDRIDMGYDLCVTPDRAIYKGARFLVQVKGTAQKKKGAVVAPVEKSRLRQYASDVLPVYIIRATADGGLYWVHAQNWARINKSRLSGNGAGGVRFDLACALGDRASFEAHLVEVFSRSPAAGDLAVLADESRLLNSLDPRFGVRIDVRDGTKQHQVFAKTEGAEGRFTFSPLRSPENLTKLQEALDFGLPRSIEVESFTLSGSPLFEHLGTNRLGKGTLTVSEASPHAGMIRLFPGSKYSITATELALEADLFSGLKGAAITNQGKESALDVDIRLLAQHGPGNIKANFAIRSSFISRLPIQEVHQLRSLAAWSEQVLLQRSMLMELEFKGRRVAAGVSDEGIASLHPFLHFARTLSRLHLIARSLNSGFTLPAEFEISAEDVGDLDLAYALLKGERIPANLGPLEFEPTRSIDEIRDHKIYGTTNLSLSIMGQQLGTIPVAMEFADYVFERVPGTQKMLLINTGNGQAWLSYEEHGDEGICVRSAQGE